MGDKEIRDLARASIDAFNDADWNRWRELHAPNAVYDEIATNRRLIGHDEIVDVLEGWRTAFPDVKGTIKNLMVAENQAVCEVTWVGTHNGDLKTPFGVFPPSGKPSTIKAMQILKMENDLIIENRQYFDFLGMLRQLGALPESLSKAAGA